MTIRLALLPLLSRSWLLALFSCSVTVLANSHLKTPQNDCSATHLKQHPRHILPCYLQKPDNHYHWQAAKPSEQTVIFADKKKTITTHSIEMASQRWPVDQKHSVNHPVWMHRVTVYQPEKVVHDSALLFINGGRLYSENDKPLITKQSLNNDLDFAYIAALTQSIVIDLKDVPNQYLQFSDQKPLKEDALVAYTWEEFIKDPDENAFMPLSLPMVKATQRAMDTVQTFMGKHKLKINRFVLSGLSKRGWAAWLTAAMDNRVIAVVPMVIDVLNLQTAMDHHYQSYGRWAPAVKDYSNILTRLHSKPLTQLMQVVDPIHYVQQLKLPKYIVSAANDDFFLPDASRHYFGDLKGNTWLRTLPNARHYIASTDNQLITDTLASFYGSVIEQRPMPSVHWELKGNDLRVTSTIPPKSAKLWTAVNPEARDFRLTPDNPTVKPFSAKDLTVKCNNVCRIKVSIANQQKGWKASFVELEFANPPFKNFTVTTQLFITPDSFPARLQKD